MKNARISLPLVVLLGAALALAFQPQEKDAVNQPGDAPVSVQEDVLYGSVNGSQLRLDIYKPGTGDSGLQPALHPAVLLIHGGGWSSLDKSTMHTMGQFLARHGLVAFAVDYRLFQGTQDRWPAQLDDVQRAVRWVRANASTYGVKPEQLGAFGHSAGAQLAA